MLQPMVRRIALGAMQAALAAAGIFVIMLLFSRPAHAATAALPPLRSTQTTLADRRRRPSRCGPDRLGRRLGRRLDRAAPVTRPPRRLGPGHRRRRSGRHHRCQDPGPRHRRRRPGRQHDGQDPGTRHQHGHPVVTTVAKTLAPVTGAVAPVVTTAHQDAGTGHRRDHPVVTVKTLAPVTSALPPVVTTVTKTLAPVTGARHPGRATTVITDPGPRHQHGHHGQRRSHPVAATRH